MIAATVFKFGDKIPTTEPTAKPHNKEQPTVKAKPHNILYHGSRFNPLTKYKKIETKVNKIINGGIGKNNAEK